MVKGLILTHGDLGRALLNTTQKIIGELSGVKVLSNEQISMKDLVLNLDTAVKDLGENEEILVFVDFFGGSCWHAAQMVKKNRQNIVLLSGVNLPIMLAFFSKRNSYRLAELAEYLKESSYKATIIVADSEENTGSEDDEG
ncbi:PTS sugar transporter subunit IIA [candidate division KSB1 bacterium]